jgi:hypothetical protein
VAEPDAIIIAVRSRAVLKRKNRFRVLRRYGLAVMSQTYSDRSVVEGLCPVEHATFPAYPKPE